MLLRYVSTEGSSCNPLAPVYQTLLLATPLMPIVSIINAGSWLVLDGKLFLPVQPFEFHVLP